MMILFVIILLIYFFVVVTWQSLEYPKERKGESVNAPIQTELFKRRGDLLKQRRLRLETLYYKIIDPLEAFLNMQNVKFQAFYLSEFNLFADWDRGVHSSAYVYKKLELINKQEAAENKVLKRITQLMEAYNNTAGKEDFISKRIFTALEELKDKVIPEYVDYLKIAERYFYQAAEVDKKQPTVLYISSGDKNSKEYLFDTFTINQAVKFINYFDIGNSSNKYIMNDYMVVFENYNSEQNNCAIDCFVLSSSFVKIFRNMYKIKLNKKTKKITHEDFYKGIEETLKSKFVS